MIQLFGRGAAVLALVLVFYIAAGGLMSEHVLRTKVRLHSIATR